MKLIVTEKGTIEGYTAGWVAARSLKHDCEWIQIAQGERIPQYEDRDVLSFGIAYSRAYLSQIQKKVSSLYVFDNDYRSKFEIGSMKNVKVNIRHSAARMAWEYLRSEFRVKIGKDKKAEFAFLSAPWVVDYSEREGLWKWPAVSKFYVKLAIQSKFTETLESWDELASRDLGSVERQGMETAKELAGKKQSNEETKDNAPERPEVTAGQDPREKQAVKNRRGAAEKSE